MSISSQGSMIRLTVNPSGGQSNHTLAYPCAGFFRYDTPRWPAARGHEESQPSRSKEAQPMNPPDQRQLLADVEAFCEELRPIEELCYVEHRFNDQVIPLARKYNLLGIPVPTAYGGRGADTVTYVRALARSGREC